MHNFICGGATDLASKRGLSASEINSVAGGSSQLVDGSKTSDQSLSYVYGHTAYAAAWLSGSPSVFGINFYRRS